MAADAEDVGEDHADRASVTGDQYSFAARLRDQVAPRSEDALLEHVVRVPADPLEITVPHRVEVVRESLREHLRRAVDPRVAIDLGEIRQDLGLEPQAVRGRHRRLDRPLLVRGDHVVDRLVGEPFTELFGLPMAALGQVRIDGPVLTHHRDGLAVSDEQNLHRATSLSTGLAGGDSRSGRARDRAGATRYHRVPAHVRRGEER